MPFSTAERVERIRGIRLRLLNVQERRNTASTPTGAKQELMEAMAELVVFAKLEYPEAEEVSSGKQRRSPG